MGSLGTCIPYKIAFGKKNLTGPGNKAACTVLTDGANLLSDLIRHGLMKVLELHTQSKVPQLDGAIG